VEIFNEEKKKTIQSEFLRRASKRVR